MKNHLNSRIVELYMKDSEKAVNLLKTMMEDMQAQREVIEEQTRRIEKHIKNTKAQKDTLTEERFRIQMDDFNQQMKNLTNHRLMIENNIKKIHAQRQEIANIDI